MRSKALTRPSKHDPRGVDPSAAPGRRTLTERYVARHDAQAAGGATPAVQPKRPGWASTAAEVLTAGALDWTPEARWMKQRLKDTTEGVLLGTQRSAEGLGVAGAERQREIGLENERMALLLGQLLRSRGHVLDVLSGLAITYTAGRILERLSPAERLRLQRELLGRVGDKLLLEALKLALVKVAKDQFLKQVVALIAESAAYRKLASAIGVSASRQPATGTGSTPGHSGVGAVLTLLIVQGTLQEAGDARSRCRAEHPELHRELSTRGLDMGYFLVEDHLATIASLVTRIVRSS
jgi:hypothetical protein